MPEVEVNGRRLAVQRMTLCKALRVITLLNQIQKLVPEATEVLGRFVSEYRSTHVEELDRVQAKLRFGGQIPVVEDGEPVLQKDGTPLTMPMPIETLSERDWERAGHKYRRPEDPPVPAMVAALLPLVTEKAEQPVLRLLAVCVTDNADFKRYVRDGVWEERADELVRDALEDAYLTEVLELAMTVGEVLEGDVLAKVGEVAKRSGKLLRRMGITVPDQAVPAGPPQPNTPVEDSKPSGSESSTTEDSTGDSTTSGTSPGTSPSTSPTDGTETLNEPVSSEPAARA